MAWRGGEGANLPGTRVQHVGVHPRALAHARMVVSVVEVVERCCVVHGLAEAGLVLDCQIGWAHNWWHASVARCQLAARVVQCEHVDRWMDGSHRVTGKPGGVMRQMQMTGHAEGISNMHGQWSGI